MAHGSMVPERLGAEPAQVKALAFATRFTCFLFFVFVSCFLFPEPKLGKLDVKHFLVLLLRKSLETKVGCSNN